ncbi:MAG: hypothetical protein ACKOC5_19740 [Chloroflexota bacterium]
MKLSQRIFLSLLIGAACLALCWLRLAWRDRLGADFTFPWRAAQAVLHGQNPYTTIQPTGAYPYQTYFYYPLTAALAALPFAGLPALPAAALFFGLSSALLAFALTADGWERLPLLLGAPFGVALAVAQWSPLVTAAALLPGLEWLLACKPNLGAALLCGLGSEQPQAPISLGRYAGALLGPLAFLGLSLALQPDWVQHWLNVTRAIQGHPPPVASLPFGPLLLLAGLKWRLAHGRLLLAMALAPQLLFFYDQLPLGLLARGWKSGLLYAGLTWLGYFAWRLAGGTDGIDVAFQPHQAVMLLVYLPALGLLFWPERGRRPHAQQWRNDGA